MSANYWEYAARAERFAPVESQQTYWEKPENVAGAYFDITHDPKRDWDKLGVNRDFVSSAYEKLADYNGHSRWWEWQPLPYEDPWRDNLLGMVEPDSTVKWSDAYKPDWMTKGGGTGGSALVADAMSDPNVPSWQKAMKVFEASPVLQGMAMALPWMAKGVVAGMLAGNVPGAIVGGVGGLAWGAFLGFTGDAENQAWARERLLASGMPKERVDLLQRTFNDTLALLNWPAEAVEQSLGAAVMFGKPLVDMMYHRISGNETALDNYLTASQEFNDLIRNYQDVLEAGRLGYEALSTSVYGNWFGNLPAGVQWLFDADMRDELQFTKAGQVWNLGNKDPQNIPLAGVALMESFYNKIKSGKEDPRKLIEEYQAMTGFTGMWTDLWAQTALDPLNVAHWYEAPMVKKFAQISGNPHLELAVKGARGEGIPGIMRTYGIVLRTGKAAGVGIDPKLASDMSWFQRQVAGVTPEGYYKELLPGVRGKTEQAKRAFLSWSESPFLPFSYWRAWTELTPASKFNGYHGMALSHLGEQISNFDAAHEGEMVDTIRRLTGDRGLTPQEALVIGRQFANPEFATVLLGLKGFDKKLDRYDGVRQLARDHVEMVSRIAEATGQDYHGLLNRIRDADARQIRAIYGELVNQARQMSQATTPEGRAKAQAAVNLLSNPNFTPDFVLQTAELAKNSKWAFSFEQYQAFLYNEMADHAIKWAIDAYKVRPDNSLIRAGNAFKKLQSILLLGFSPSFGITNVAGNISTSAAEHVYGFVGPETKRWYLEEFLGHPESKVAAGFTMADEYARRAKKPKYANSGEASEAGRYESMKWTAEATDALGREAMRAKDTIQKMTDKIGTGPVQKISGWAEDQSALSVHYTWTMGTMRRWFNRNTGIPQMPERLRSSLERIDPGLPNLILSYIEQSRTKMDITRLLTGVTQLGRTADPYIEATCKALGVNSARTRDMLARTNIIEKIDRRLADGLRPEDAIASVMEDALKVIREGERQRIRNEIMGGQVRVAGEGLQAVVRPFNDAVQMFNDFWNRHWDYLDNTWEIAKSLHGTDKRRFISRRLRKLDTEWKSFTDSDTALWTSMLESLGFVGPRGGRSRTTTLFTAELTRLRNEWRKFYLERTKRAGEIIRQTQGMPVAEADALWAQFKQDMDELYVRHSQVELASIEKQALLFAKGWRAKYGEKGLPGVAFWWKSIYDANKIRQDLMLDYRRYLRGETPQNPDVQNVIDNLQPGQRISWPLFVEKLYLPALSRIMQATFDGTNAVADAASGRDMRPEWDSAVQWLNGLVARRIPPTPPQPAAPSTPPGPTPPAGQTPPPSPTVPGGVGGPPPVTPPIEPAHPFDDVVLNALEEAGIDPETARNLTPEQADQILVEDFAEQVRLSEEVGNDADGKLAVDTRLNELEITDSVQRMLDDEGVEQLYDWTIPEERRAALTELFYVPESEVDNVMKIMDLTAETWGRRNRRDPKEYWSHLDGVERGPNQLQEQAWIEQNMTQIGEIPLRFADEEPLYSWGPYKRTEGEVLIAQRDPKTGEWYTLDPAKWDQPDYQATEWKHVADRLRKELEQYELLFGEIHPDMAMDVNINGVSRKVINPLVFQRSMLRSITDGTMTRILDARVPVEQLAIERGLTVDSDPNSAYVRFMKQADAMREDWITIQRNAKGEKTAAGSDFILVDNGKAGQSVDFLLGTCQPTENCKVCYAASGMMRQSLVNKVLRNTMLMLYDPVSYGKQIAVEVKRQSQVTLPFVRMLGSGDLSSEHMVTCFNALAQNCDRPIHIFSRHHDNLAKLRGTAAAPFIKLGSIDLTLWDYYSKDYLFNNLHERGINNCFLFANEKEIPYLVELARHDAIGVIFAANKNLHDKLPQELKQFSCPCDARERNFYNSCRQCALSGAGCFMVASRLMYDPVSDRYYRYSNKDIGLEIPDSARLLLDLYKGLRGITEDELLVRLGESKLPDTGRDDIVWADVIEAYPEKRMLPMTLAMSESAKNVIWYAYNQTKSKYKKMFPTDRQGNPKPSDTHHVSLYDPLYPETIIRFVDEAAVPLEKRAKYMRSEEKKERSKSKNKGYYELLNTQYKYVFMPRERVQEEVLRILDWYVDRMENAVRTGTWWQRGDVEGIQPPIASQNYKIMNALDEATLSDIARMREELRPPWQSMPISSDATPLWNGGIGTSDYWQTARGAYLTKGSQRLIQALNNAAPDTIMHELAHYHYDFGLSNNDRAIVYNWAVRSGYVKTFLYNMVGQKMNNRTITMQEIDLAMRNRDGSLWWRAVKEAYADGYTRWLATGTLPKTAPEGLRGVFKRFREFMRGVFSSVYGPGKFPGMGKWEGDPVLGVFRRTLMMDPWETPLPEGSSIEQIKAHRDSVLEALNDGLMVPDEVMAQHPDIYEIARNKATANIPISPGEESLLPAGFLAAEHLGQMSDETLRLMGYGAEDEKGQVRHLLNSINKERVFDAINEERRKNGQDPYVWDEWGKIPKDEKKMFSDVRLKAEDITRDMVLNALRSPLRLGPDALLQGPVSRTPEFREWFGESKIVDEYGNPLVVYHGTSSDFRSFDRNFIGGGNDPGFYGAGYYFTNQPGYASAYADSAMAYKLNRVGRGDRIDVGANVMPCYLRMQNPYYYPKESYSFTTPNDLVGLVPPIEYVTGYGESTPEQRRAWSMRMTEVLIELGYDGIVVDTGGSYKEYVAFFDSNIKSIYNQYPTNDPDILLETGVGKQIVTPEGLIDEYFAEFPEQAKLIKKALNLDPEGVGEFENQALYKVDPMLAQDAAQWLVDAWPYNEAKEGDLPEWVLNNEINSILQDFADAGVTPGSIKPVQTGAKPPVSKIGAVAEQPPLPELAPLGIKPIKFFEGQWGRWFRQSRVRDNKGMPLKVYHGTPNAFTVFSRTSDVLGFHFGTIGAARRAKASTRKGGKWSIGEYYLRVENPLELPDMGQWLPQDLIEKLKKLYIMPHDYTYEKYLQEVADRFAERDPVLYRMVTESDAAARIDPWEWQSYVDQFKQKLSIYRREVMVGYIERAGHDGIRYVNTYEGGVSWIIFHPEQAKSSLNTRPTENPDYLLHSSVNPTGPENEITVQRFPEPRKVANRWVVGATLMNGNFIAYIPWMMKLNQVIDTASGRARLLGIDTNGNYLYRFEDTGEIRVLGDGEDVVQPAGPFVEGTMEASGAVPTDEGTQWYDGMANFVEPFMDELLKQMKSGPPMTDAGANLSRLGVEDQAQMKRWIEDVMREFSRTKMAAIRMGDRHKEMALLDYQKRYNFDNYVGLLLPYQFWFSRSMVNWGLRFLDRPGILSFFARYAQYGDDESDERFNTIPSRLKGKIKVDVPWLNAIAPWAGGSIYVDPWGKLFNFRELLRPWERYMMDNTRVMRQAERLMREWVKSGEYTEEQMTEAIKSKDGELWLRAYTQAKQEEGGDAIDFMNLLSSPNLAVSLAVRGLEGTGPFPPSRLMQGLSAVTGWEGLSNLDPEAALRRNAKLSEFGEWGVWYVDRMLSNMVAEGLFTAEEGVLAMIEREGKAYDMATERVRLELAIREPSLLPFLATRNWIEGNGNVLDILGSVLMTWMPGGLLPEGELKMRGLYNEYNAAWRAKDAGDEEAVNNFFKQHPEFEARLALYDKPEERMREFLKSNVWDALHKVPDLWKDTAINQLEQSDVFREMFYNSDTADPDAISADLLATWAQQLKQFGGYAPKGATTTYASPVELGSGDAVRSYESQKTSLFPNIDRIEDIYWDAPEDQRNQILKQYPILQSYWEWRDLFIANNPELIPYAIKDDSKLGTADPQTAYAVYMFRAEKARLFPGIGIILNEYFSLSKEERRAFSRANPEVGKYYDWEEQYLKSFPEIVPYVKSSASTAKSKLGEGYTQSYGTQVNVYQYPSEVQSALMGYFVAKRPLSDGSQSYLYYQWEKAGKPGDSFKEWLDGLGVYYGVIR